MKIMQLQDNWGPENIKLAERAAPEPGPGEVVIAIKATSINPRDLVVVSGGYSRQGSKLPLVPLCDGAGEIVATGSGVTKFKLGDMVCPTYSRTWQHDTASIDSPKGSHGAEVDGTMQELMLIPEHSVVKAPSHMTAAQAATLPCAAVTAWNALIEQGGIRAGDRVLIQGTGSVALFALQFAKMHGAEVIVTSSSDEKLERVKAMGADHLVNYRKNPDWHKFARKLTNGKGVDHVVEIGGAGTLEKSTAAVKPSGTISMIGILGGIEGTFNLGRVVTRNLRLQGVTVGSRAAFENMNRAIELHKLVPVIDARSFKFEEVGTALTWLPQGQHFGKIVCEFE